MTDPKTNPIPKPVHPREAQPPHLRIAIPTTAGRLHSHFGGAGQFAIIDADAASQAILSVTVVSAPPHKPGLLPHWLADQGVQTVIAAGIGQRALEIFAHHGITVRAGPPNTSVQELVITFLHGGLTTGPQGCDHHDHEHPHEHHHDCQQ